MRKLFVAVSLWAIAGAANAAVITVTPDGDAQEKVQTALLDAKPGDVVELAAGKFVFTDGLSLDIDNVTVRGAGPDKTILSFAGQKGAGEGLLITSDKVTVRDLAVEDSKGDGLKAKGVDQISFLNVRVEWSGGPKESNGAYGVYPVSSTNVLIDRAVVRGASDAGIYVGQSKNIIVKNSTAEFNVAGIEIENCYGADVFDNVATRNAGGILVFDMPSLPQKNGHSVRVFRNKVVKNDVANFAPKGNIVASVPTGTGVMVMANRNVHVYGNEIDDNQTAAVMLVAFQKEYDDADYNPLPREVVVRDNKIGKNGFAPQFPGGAELAQAVGGVIPPILWDGVTTYSKGAEKVSIPANMRLTDGPVLNLHLAGPAAMDTAKPGVDATVEAGAAIAEPPAVVLPAEQAKLAP
ncbi:parallel beta-helix domain-containing protein [Caulobacter sp. NIBR2454]|uniref:parallel beta-helix domain-containing protein n=1 Tax=Caulobacter sp. NIBR2454 TaxID=3015996 RepID=UPI0022B63286|nr:parallel beta-helix domain-containing protein [Caulobacter sp. NIBR2454]